MEVDVEANLNVENPLHVDNIPIANLVVIEVEGQPILDPKIEQVCDTLEKILDGIKICGAILVLLGMFGGMLSLFVWMFDPFVFGNVIDD